MHPCVYIRYGMMASQIISWITKPIPAFTWNAETFHKTNMTPSLTEPKFHEKSLIKTLQVDVNVSLIKAIFLIFFLTDPIVRSTI